MILDQKQFRAELFQWIKKALNKGDPVAPSQRGRRAIASTESPQASRRFHDVLVLILVHHLTFRCD